MTEQMLVEVPKKIEGFVAAGKGLLQRRCSKCSMKDENKRKGILQRSAIQEGPEQVPPIVDEVLREPGRPLDAGTRAFMEPRFGHDFSLVRVHTEAKAAESARAVNALAYTAGNNIVFASRQFDPGNTPGRELLAHELVHVIQQEHSLSRSVPSRISQPSDPAEVNAEHLSYSWLSNGRHSPDIIESSLPVLSRRVIPRLVHCTAGNDGAPADPVTELTTRVDGAEGMATAAGILLSIDAALIQAGMRPTASTVDQAFVRRFGEPPAVAGGFMNRLTGAVRPSFDIALSEEMELMVRRYELVANQFASGFTHYLCMSTARSFGGCSPPDCSNDAWACPGVNAIFLCPGFWVGDPRSSTLLIHEMSHQIWGSVRHGARGSGGNFRHAECYASFISDIFGLTPGGPACPAP